MIGRRLGLRAERGAAVGCRVRRSPVRLARLAKSPRIAQPLGAAWPFDSATLVASDARRVEQSSFRSSLRRVDAVPNHRACYLGRHSHHSLAVCAGSSTRPNTDWRGRMGVVPQNSPRSPNATTPSSLPAPRIARQPPRYQVWRADRPPAGRTEAASLRGYGPATVAHTQRPMCPRSVDRGPRRRSDDGAYGHPPFAAANGRRPLPRGAARRGRRPDHDRDLPLGARGLSALGDDRAAADPGRLHAGPGAHLRGLS